MDRDPIEKHLHKPISEILVNKGFFKDFTYLKISEQNTEKHELNNVRKPKITEHFPLSNNIRKD